MVDGRNRIPSSSVSTRCPHHALALSAFLAFLLLFSERAWRVWLDYWHIIVSKAHRRAIQGWCMYKVSIAM